MQAGITDIERLNKEWVERKGEYQDWVAKNVNQEDNK